MAEILDYIIKAALGVLITGVLTAIGIYIKSAIQRTRALTLAVKALSHDALFRHCRRIINKSCITEEEHENLEHLYETYSLLGMNGTGRKMYEICSEKPIKINQGMKGES